MVHRTVKELLKCLYVFQLLTLIYNFEQFFSLDSESFIETPDTVPYRYCTLTIGSELSKEIKDTVYCKQTKLS